MNRSKAVLLKWLFFSDIFQMLHPKTIHFPSGYPISRSPPVFVCASPGPDPYRSLDNVYEELGPRDSDIESEPRVQSDDDFAEDELSLNGGAAQPYHISSSIQDGAVATANTSIPMATSTSTCAAISQTIPSISSLYNECMNSSGTTNGNHCSSDNNNGENSHSNPNELERNSNDRHSLISSSSSSASTAPVNDGAAGNSNSSFSSGPTRVASPDSGLALRNRTKRMRNGGSGKMPPSPANDLPIASRMNNENGSHDDTSSESNHLMNQHPYYNHHHHHQHQSQNHNYNQYRNNNNIELSHSNSNNSSISNQLNNVNNNVNSRNVGNAMSNGSGHMNGSNSIDVERHNQINKQLTSATEHPMIPKFGGNRTTVPTNYQSQMAQDQMISTIFPGRLINSNSNLNNYNRIQMQNQYYSPSDSVVRCSGNSSRSRTNPRSSRHRSSGNTLPYSYQNDNTYSYAEPVFHEDLASACAPPLLGGYRTISTSNRRPYHSSNHHPSSYTPNYQNYGERDQRHSRNRNHIGIPSTSNEMGHIQPIYSHDSSFGSDSGYSQYTHNSRAKSDGSNSAHSGSSNGNTSSLSNMFSWARRKDQQQSNRTKTNGGKPVPPMRNS